jgi:hypothetical protein
LVAVRQIFRHEAVGRLPVEIWEIFVYRSLYVTLG